MWDGVSEWKYPFPHDEIRPAGTLAIGMKFDGMDWYMPEMPVNDWLHPDYEKRIIAPATIATSYPELLFELTVVRKLPVEAVGENVHIYCNYIDPEHQQLVDALSLTVENKA
jgi:hypothetical protein